MSQFDLFSSILTAPREGRGPADVRVGRQRAEAGAELAADHADALSNHTWSALAESLLLRYTVLHPRESFIAHDVRRFAEEAGLPRPPDERAWGAVFLRASRAGVVRPTGAWESGGAICHSRPQRCWMAA